VRIFKEDNKITVAFLYYSLVTDYTVKDAGSVKVTRQELLDGDRICSESEIEGNENLSSVVNVLREKTNEYLEEL
jgi:hypothetical protein